MFIKMTTPTTPEMTGGIPRIIAHADAVPVSRGRMLGDLADATGTLGYYRCAGADDILDGEAGTSGSDFNFNTLSIVAASTVSMTSFTVDVNE